ncbi:Glutathione transport system permease protein gsiC [Cedecea neteri]|uniref:Glutathione transport system permease protein gsiC n=1 Tax=Cedecea neteri TaxID=158822 RepID=A0A2X3IER1_9ENTR|nr:Glutathione transport system permease protein gsiC [Cedecea neteri]
MNNLLFRRLLQLLPMLLFISLVSFLLVKLAPGDPVQAYITPRMSPDDIDRIRQSMGLDKPLPVQYLLWLKNLLQGDLGYSLIYHRPVLTMIVERIPATLGLMGASLLLAILLAIPLGLLAGAFKHRWLDHVLNLFAYVGISVPIFWFGILLITVFSVQLNWLPSMGMRTIGVADSLARCDSSRHFALHRADVLQPRQLTCATSVRIPSASCQPTMCKPSWPTGRPAAPFCSGMC